MPKGKFSFKGNSAQARSVAPGQVRKAADVPAKVAPAVRVGARVGADGVAGVGVRRGPAVGPAVQPARRDAFAAQTGQARPPTSSVKTAAKPAVSAAVQPTEAVRKPTASPFKKTRRN